MNEYKKLANKIISMSREDQKSFFERLDDKQKDLVAFAMKAQLNKYILEENKKPNIKDPTTSFSEWILAHFYIPEQDNGPIKLAKYQIYALDLATSKDADGLYNYSLIAWMDIKKSIKSCIAGAVALRMAFMREWASIKVVANKREQAQSRSYYYIVRSLKLNPETKEMLDKGDISITHYTINFNFNNSTIKAIPLNPEGEAGGNDDLIIWTEAWAAKTKAAKTMWTEMVIPPNKFGQGFKWIESYAGFSGESPILEPIYLENVKDDYKIKNTDMYSNGRTFCLCNHKPHLPWQTSEYYEQQAKELIPAEFDRVHRNIWQSSTSKFVDDLQWDLCKKNIPPLNPREKILLGVDVGLVNDYFAIVAVNKINGKVAVRLVKVWEPKNGKILFTNPTDDKSLDIEYPYGYIVALSKHYKIIGLHYDPYQAEKLAEDLTRNRIVNCKPFLQQAERYKSDKYLFDLIRSQDIIHNGNPILTQHIKNAQVQNKGENKLRIVKGQQSAKVDAAVALSMAAYAARGLRF